MQQKITLKYILMRNYQETDSSINQILEMLKNYRNEGRHRQSSDFSFDSKMHFNHPSDLNFTSFILTNRHEQSTHLKQRLNSSMQNISTKQNSKPSLYLQPRKLQPNSIFQRLYEEVCLPKVENLDLKKRRERLFQEGKRKKVDLEINQCTFSPNVRSLSKSKQSKCTETQAEQFYKKGIDWQNRLVLANRTKKCQKNTEQIKQYTFSPQIYFSKSRSKGKDDKQNSCLKNKGVTRHLDRQAKARQAEQLLKARWATVKSNGHNAYLKPFVF